MGLDRLHAVLFDHRTGDYIRRIPVAAGSTWTRVINAPGDVKVKVPRRQHAFLADLHTIAKPWSVDVALMRGDRILQAGPVVRRPWDSTLTLEAKGAWATFDKFLVLNHALASMTIDGEVLIDEENPAPEWLLTFNGSYPDIASQLVTEAMKWDQRPVIAPPLQGGIFTRTYWGSDLAQVSERLSQLTQLQNGPELRFDPRLRPDGGIEYALEGDHEIVDHVWEWNTAIPGQGVKIVSLDDDGEGMTTDVWAQGGRGGAEDGDVLLVTRQTGTFPGKPLLQAANTSHSSVSEIATLRGHARGQMYRSMNTYGQVQLEAPVRYDVQSGDWIDLRTENPYFGRTTLELKVVGVSGGTGERQKIDTRVRYEE